MPVTTPWEELKYGVDLGWILTPSHAPVDLADGVAVLRYRRDNGTVDFNLHIECGRYTNFPSRTEGWVFELPDQLIKRRALVYGTYTQASSGGNASVNSTVYVDFHDYNPAFPYNACLFPYSSVTDLAWTADAPFVFSVGDHYDLGNALEGLDN